MSYARSTKRAFQPQISSYFTPTNTRNASHVPHAPSIVPSIPDQVQASLMRVGMRVRKAVPEGYQTKEKDIYTPTVPAPSHVSSSSGSQVLQPQRQPNIQFSRPAELTPFCGLNKIGGLGVQTYYDDEEDAFPSGSQESIMSNASTESVPQLARSTGTANMRKRSMRDEEEEAADDARDGVIDPAYFDTRLWQAGVWEREAIGGMRVGERRIAKAVSRRKDVNMSTEDDFDDAGFLVQSDEEMMA